MKIIVGEEHIEVNRIFEGVAFDEETQRERVVVEVYTDEPLTADEIETLKNGMWTFEDDDREYDGMSIVLDNCTRFMQMSKISPREEKNLEMENARLSQEVNDARETANAEIESLLQAARDGRLSPPVPGEPWDADKWHRAGDTVTWQDKQLHRCLKTCKNKAPDAAADYWELVPDAAPDILVWADIKSGTAIEVGTLVSHNNAIWRCIKTHTKAQVRQPSAVQTDYWEVYNDA